MQQTTRPHGHWSSGSPGSSEKLNLRLVIGPSSGFLQGNGQWICRSFAVGLESIPFGLPDEHDESFPGKKVDETKPPMVIWRKYNRSWHMKRTTKWAQSWLEIRLWVETTRVKKKHMFSWTTMNSLPISLPSCLLTFLASASWCCKWTRDVQHQVAWTHMQALMVSVPFVDQCCASWDNTAFKMTRPDLAAVTEGRTENES